MPEIESYCVSFWPFFFPFLVLRNLFGVMGEFDCDDLGLMGLSFLNVAGLWCTFRLDRLICFNIYFIDSESFPWLVIYGISYRGAAGC